MVMLEKILAHFGYTKKPLSKKARQWSVKAKQRAQQRKAYHANRINILRKMHQKELPVLHTPDCPACNPDSPLSLDEYILQQRQMCQKLAQKARLEKKTKSFKPVDETQLHIMEDKIPSKDFATHDRPHHDIIQRPQDSEPKGGYIQ